MTTVPFAMSARGFVLTLLLAASGCSNIAKPGPPSVAGMSPDDTVSITEIWRPERKAGRAR